MASYWFFWILFRLIFLFGLSFCEQCLTSYPIFYENRDLIYKCEKNTTNFEVIKEQWNQWLKLVSLSNNISKRSNNFYDKVNNVKNKNKVSVVEELYEHFKDTPYCCKLMTGDPHDFCYNFVQDRDKLPMIDFSCSSYNYQHIASKSLTKSLVCGTSSTKPADHIYCCNSRAGENLCNSPTSEQLMAVRRILEKTESEVISKDIRWEQKMNSTDNNYMTISVLVVICCVLLVLLLGLLMRQKCRRQAALRAIDKFRNCSAIVCIRHRLYRCPHHNDLNCHMGNSALTKVVGDTLSNSGSGMGLPLLVERTVSRQVALANIIGSGRHGVVFRAKWYNEDVAVKIFSSRDEHSFQREAEIYQTALLRHENVLGFIAIDNIDVGYETQLWLVTDYHPLGSLFDYLQTNEPDLETSLSMALSIANGLNHLHTEIQGSPQGKPAIAHRDIKSRNILVSRPGECCIADLGLAVRHNSSKGCGQSEVDVPDNPTRVGTKRYMAPECLDGSMDCQSFQAYMQADIYSLGLVLWELACRIRDSKYGIVAQTYKLPYQDCVPGDPSVEEMREFVSRPRNQRPEAPSELLLKHPIGGRLMHLISECWYPEATARLTSFRAKKSLSLMRFQLINPSSLTIHGAISRATLGLEGASCSASSGACDLHQSSQENTAA